MTTRDLTPDEQRQALALLRELALADGDIYPGDISDPNKRETAYQTECYTYWLLREAAAALLAAVDSAGAQEADE